MTYKITIKNVSFACIAIMVTIFAFSMVGCSKTAGSITQGQIYKKDTGIAVLTVKSSKKICAKSSFSIAKRVSSKGYSYQLVKIVAKKQPVQRVELQPGSYDIVSFQCIVRLGKKRWAKNVGAPSEEDKYKFSLASFQIKKGQVTNIGRLVFKKPGFADRKVKLRVRDLSEKELDWLKRNHPGLHKRMKRNLMTLNRKKLSL